MEYGILRLLLARVFSIRGIDPCVQVHDDGEHGQNPVHVLGLPVLTGSKDLMVVHVGRAAH